MPPAAIVFDNDGLLLDTEAAWTRAETALFANHGGIFTFEHKRDLIGSSHTVAAGKLEAMLGMPGRGPELMDELHELVMDEALHDVEPRPGAVELDHPGGTRGEPIGQACRGQDDRRAAVPEHVRQPLGRVLGIERDVSTAGLENREQRHRHLHRTIQQNADSRFRADTVLL